MYVNLCRAFNIKYCSVKIFCILNYLIPAVNTANKYNDIAYKFYN